MEEKTPLKRAAEVIGTESALAALIGCSRGRVHQWHTRGVPAKFCPLIEKVTQGEVRCEDLRPDVEWVVLRG